MYLHKACTRCSGQASRRPRPRARLPGGRPVGARRARHLSEHFGAGGVVDDELQFRRLVSFFSRTAPELVERVELWEEETPLFEAFGVDKAIDGLLSGA